jgi:hypothetical protein
MLQKDAIVVQFSLDRIDMPSEILNTPDNPQ